MTPTFEDRYGAPPLATARAPGRVNLLGEHTDYNDGFVLPTAIPQTTVVGLGPSPDADFHFYAARLGEAAAWTPGGALPEGFARYLVGCVEGLRGRGVDLPPLAFHVDSTVPIGAGLSSSAALEIAALRALREGFALDLDDVELARIAQEAEIRFAGVRCGIMDQMACSLADAAHMLFLDTRSLERRLLPLPAGAELLVVDSGIPRTLAGSMYNQRRAECERAAALLGAASLREVADPAAADRLPAPLDRRARHVLSENARVLAAAGGVPAARFGELMNASHQSLRDDYEVSVPGLDRLVGLLVARPEVFGARLTGAGFGGACVALVRAGQAAAAGRAVASAYGEAGGHATVLVPDDGRARNAAQDPTQNSIRDCAQNHGATPAQP